MSRMIELSESRSRFERIKRLASNWKFVAVGSVLFLTGKSAAEQLVLLFR